MANRYDAAIAAVERVPAGDLRKAAFEAELKRRENHWFVRLLAPVTSLVAVGGLVLSAWTAIDSSKQQSEARALEKRAPLLKVMEQRYGAHQKLLDQLSQLQGLAKDDARRSKLLEIQALVRGASRLDLDETIVNGVKELLELENVRMQQPAPDGSDVKAENQLRAVIELVAKTGAQLRDLWVSTSAM